MKGFDALPVNDKMIQEADKLTLALDSRLSYHIGERVDSSRQNHWTLRFVCDNLAPVVAGMCLAEHIVDNIDT